MARFGHLAFGVLMALSACSGESETAEPSSSTAAPDTTLAATTTTAITLFSDEEAEANLLAAEAFVDAFYSVEPASLEIQFAPDSEGPPFWLFYQGWAEGANYEVVNREACVRSRVTGIIRCAITVRDDLVLALGLDFNVTDTFEFERFSGEGAVTEVNLSSNDPDLVRDAFEWVEAAHPDYREGVCRDRFRGGPTPAACAEAVAEAFREYAASDDFPGTS